MNASLMNHVDLETVPIGIDGRYMQGIPVPQLGVLPGSRAPLRQNPSGAVQNAAVLVDGGCPEDNLLAAVPVHISYG
ncbi:hypothetical protein D3C85_1740550 [compost metagenome]